MAQEYPEVPVAQQKTSDDARTANRLLEIDNLSIGFPTRTGMVRGIDDLSIAIGTHERVGLVGESGSGKSVMGLAMLGLIRPPGRVLAGDVKWSGRSMFDSKVAREVRGREISMIFQDPMVSLDPLMSIGSQLTEILRRRAGMGRTSARNRAVELLERVGITPAKSRMKQYPFELSGGMRQRVMIATALAGNPKLIIADEPTTGLDVTIQGQILQLLGEISRDLGVSIVMITHDLGVVAEFCDRVQVLYGGRLVERAPVGPAFASPAHPYTRGLLGSMPRIDERSMGRLPSIPGDPLDRVVESHGCAFAPRCADVEARCTHGDAPELLRITGDRRWVSCWSAQNNEGVLR